VIINPELLTISQSSSKALTLKLITHELIMPHQLLHPPLLVIAYQYLILELSTP